eukprot:scaffold7752_cov31-Phaeocystis_antarctica.AAC.3
MAIAQADERFLARAHARGGSARLVRAPSMDDDTLIAQACPGRRHADRAGRRGGGQRGDLSQARRRLRCRHPNGDARAVHTRAAASTRLPRGWRPGADGRGQQCVGCRQRTLPCA